MPIMTIIVWHLTCVFSLLRTSCCVDIGPVVTSMGCTRMNCYSNKLILKAVLFWRLLILIFLFILLSFFTLLTFCLVIFVLI